jgi:hypothetical protein
MNNYLVRVSNGHFYVLQTPKIYKVGDRHTENRVIVQTNLEIARGGCLYPITEL